MADLVSWGLGGQLFGGVGSYCAVAAYGRATELPLPISPLTVANHTTYRAAGFTIGVALAGHLLRPVLG
jgi:hypothetical protein